MRPVAAILLLLIARTVSADPIISGPDGYLELSTLNGSLVWTADQHLRVAVFHDGETGSEATTHEAQQRVIESMLDGLWIYRLPISSVDACGRTQVDLEWTPGAGKHIIIDTSAWCVSPASIALQGSGITSTYQPNPFIDTQVIDSNQTYIDISQHSAPQPVPEPASLFLLGCGLCLTCVLLSRYSLP